MSSERCWSSCLAAFLHDVPCKLHDVDIGVFVTKAQTKMANAWTQFQPWQNQPLPPGWEARYDANVRR